jgi:hypothetical protein
MSIKNNLQYRVTIHKYHKNKIFRAVAILLFTILLNNISHILQVSIVFCTQNSCCYKPVTVSQVQVTAIFLMG